MTTIERSLLVPLGALGVSIVTLWPSNASAQAIEPLEPAVEEDTTGQTVPKDWPEVETSPGWAVGLDAFGGITVLTTSDTQVGHDFIGALARVRWRYLQAGATFEITDIDEGQWRAIGGFVGGFLPIRGWVDFELDGGLESRTYLNSDTRYGPNGYDFSVPALTFRLGVSDRSSSADRYAARIGAQIVGAVDLRQHAADWRYTNGNNVFSGTSHVGGFSAGLMLVLGFDVAGTKLGAYTL